MTITRITTTTPDHEADATVGEWMHLLMRRQGISQKTLAEALGMHQTSMSNKLRGRRPWTLGELQRAATVLDTDVAALCAVLPRLDSNQQPSGYLSPLVRRCDYCGLTFIGPDAIQRWSEHTWVHASEIPGLEPFADAWVLAA